MGVNWMTRLLIKMCKLIIELAFLAITLANSYQYMPEYLSYGSSTLLDIYLNESPIYVYLWKVHQENFHWKIIMFTIKGLLILKWTCVHFVSGAFNVTTFNLCGDVGWII